MAGDSVGKYVSSSPVDLMYTTADEMIRALHGRIDPPARFEGRVTDDTILTLATLDSIEASGGFSRAQLGRELRRINPRSGRQIYKLRGRPHPYFLSRDGDSNGAIPRVLAIASTSRPWDFGELAFNIQASTTLTHAGPDTQAAALLFGLLVQQGIAGESKFDAMQLALSLSNDIRALTGSNFVERWWQLSQKMRRLPPSDAFRRLVANLGLDQRATSSALVALVMSAITDSMVDGFEGMLRTIPPGDVDSTLAIFGAAVGAYSEGSVASGIMNIIESALGQSSYQVANRSWKLLSTHQHLAPPHVEWR